MSIPREIHKPANLIYGLYDRPPAGTLFLLGVQHIFVMAIGLIFPVVIMRSIDASREMTSAFVSLSMIAGGIATILQALRKGPVGSGYLCPEGPDPSFLSASILAVKSGGLSLMIAMTVIAGAFEVFLSRIIYRVRFLFPPDVTGTIVSMVGISVIPIAVPYFMGIGTNDVATSAPELIVGFITLGTIVAANVWGRGPFKMYSVLIGMTTGYVMAAILGLMTADDLQYIAQAAFIDIPRMQHPGFSFDMSMLLAFLLAITCSTLKNVGDITTCQKINDANWNRLEWSSVKGGIMADGLASIIGGLLGGMGQASYSANVGLSVAVGATSRVIAFAAGGVFITVAFFPKLAAVLTVMPRPVMGAALIFAVSFMILAGIQIIVSRMVDVRKTFVIGTGFIFGLSTLVPGTYASVPVLLQPVFSSPLALTAVTVLLMNLILSIGVAKSRSLELIPGQSGYEQIQEFLEKSGAEWGARRDIIQKAVAAVNELLESVHGLGLCSETMLLTGTFDEFNLDLELVYSGKLMAFPTERPTIEDMLENEDAMDGLPGFLIRQFADGVRAFERQGKSVIRLHFDH